MNVAVSVDRRALAGMDNDRRGGVLNHGRTGEAHAGLELFGVVDIGLMRALERIVDHPAGFQRRRERGAGLRQRRKLKLAHFGRSHEMQAHDLDRRVEPIGVFTFMHAMKSSDQVCERFLVDRAVRERDLDRMLLVLIAAFQERGELDPLLGNALRGELRARALSGLLDQRADRRGDG